MKKIEIIAKPFKLEDIRNALTMGFVKVNALL